MREKCCPIQIQKKKKIINKTIDRFDLSPKRPPLLFFLFFFRVASCINSSPFAMERETRLARGGKWTTRLAFFSFLLSRLFVSSKLSKETRRYVKSTWWRPALFLQRPSPSNPPPTPKLNQEIPFAFRRAYGVSRYVANGGRRSRKKFRFVPPLCVLAPLTFVPGCSRCIGHSCAATMTRERKRERKKKGRRIL